MKNIYLVRHAQSQSNVNLKHLQTTSNPSIELTPTGMLQAEETGAFLNKILGPSPAVVWNSPYKRTRQTANVIKSQLTHFKARESIYLSERQFGLVDDVEDYKEKFRHEANHYKIHMDSGTEFFVRPPLGESPFDMCIRLDTFLKNYIETAKEENHIIVSHGAAIRGLIMMGLGWEFEQYTKEPNPNNASVCLLTLKDEWELKGYVFKPSQVSF